MKVAKWNFIKQLLSVAMHLQLYNIFNMHIDREEFVQTTFRLFVLLWQQTTIAMMSIININTMTQIAAMMPMIAPVSKSSSSDISDAHACTCNCRCVYKIGGSPVQPTPMVFR